MVPAPSRALVNQNYDSQSQIAQVIDQEMTHLGALPGSFFYFFKRFKEAAEGLFLFGNKKTLYLVDLSQLRLKEAALLTNQNKFKLVSYDLKAYNGLSQKILKRKFLDSPEIITKLLQNNRLTQLIGLRMSENESNIDSSLKTNLTDSKEEMVKLNSEIMAEIIGLIGNKQTK
jgi:hypothetical protein